jgi:hypothetical protein
VKPVGVALLGDSIPPERRAGITWPVVAYAFVRELPYTMMVISGAVVSVVIVFRSPGSALEPIAAVVIPGIITALGRSRPAD